MPRRAPRLLSRREIFQAIQDNLARMGILRRAELQRGGLAYSVVGAGAEG